MATLELTLPAIAFAGMERMQYETPRGGISITGYIARRLHKTALLDDIETALSRRPALALMQFAIYAAAAATSWGPALYQPRFDRPGAEVAEADPDTGAQVTVRCLATEPHYTFEFDVLLPGGGRISGQEAITGTTVSLTGLGMPAPSRFRYQSADAVYEAEAIGTITSELAPHLFGPWHIRGYGALQLTDTLGQQGVLSLDRQGQASVVVRELEGQTCRASCRLA